MADFYAGGIVYEIRVDDKSGIGIAKAEGNLKKFEHETNKTGTKITFPGDFNIRRVPCLSWGHRHDCRNCNRW